MGVETFRDCTPWDDWKFRAAANDVLLGSAGNEQVLAEGEKMICFNKKGASSRHFSRSLLVQARGPVLSQMK